MNAYENGSPADTEIDVSSLFSVLWRRKGWVILWALVGLALAVGFLVLVDPVFRTDARLLIERRETVFTRPSDEQNIPVTPDFDIISVASQVEVLQSRNLLKSVVSKLKLSENPEFDPLLSGAGQGNPLSNLLTLIGMKSGNVSDTREQRVLASLAERLSVYSINDSRVVSVEVTSQSPVLAADIANAIASEYLLIQREDSRTDTQGASRFLEGEISGLRTLVAEAERKVEDFRASADLIAVDDDSTLTKQQLSETLTLLSDVSAQRAEAEAKADQIRRLINSGAALDSSSDVQGSPLIQRLREQQVNLRARIVDLQTALLPSHPQVQAARSQLDDLESEIAREALLIAKALEGDAEVAKVRQQELEQEVARLKTATARANEQEIKLRALQREARAQRELLETYLTRYRESTARQNTELLPVNARIISQAAIPIERHFPKTVPTLAVAVFAGGFLASLFILVGELLSGRPVYRNDMPLHPSESDERFEPAMKPQRAQSRDFLLDPVEDDDVPDEDPFIEEAPLVAPLSARAARAKKVAVAAEPQVELELDRPELDAPEVDEIEFDEPEFDEVEPQQAIEPEQEIVEEVALPKSDAPLMELAEVIKPEPATTQPQKLVEPDDLADDILSPAVVEMVEDASGLEEPLVEEAVGEEPAQPPVGVVVQDNEAQPPVSPAMPVSRAMPVSDIDDPGGTEETDIEEEVYTSDLYTIEDALSAIENYQLEQIVVLPVFQNVSCADLALDLSRSLANAGKSVVFVDTTAIDFEDDVALAGISDVTSGDAELEEAIFADPMSSVDLMAGGSFQLDDADWEDGRTQDVLDTLSENYSVTVLHVGEGTEVPYLHELVERSDMLLFAVDAPLSRRQVADVLREKMGEIPGHSMFVSFEEEDGVESAA